MAENTENLFTTDCIRTHSGKYFNVFEPTIEMIDINDIAHALSHLCRFGGHTPFFYSVAQHSIEVANLMPPSLKMQALLHDAAEAYLLDIPSPIKKRLNGYSELENNIMKLIAKKFKFEYPIDPMVKEADKQILEIEWRDMIIQEKSTAKILVDNLRIATHDENVFKLGNRVCFVNPSVVKAKFIEEFKIIATYFYLM